MNEIWFCYTMLFILMCLFSVEEFLVAKGEEEACKLLMSGDFETISLLQTHGQEFVYLSDILCLRWESLIHIENQSF